MLFTAPVARQGRCLIARLVLLLSCLTLTTTVLARDEPLADISLQQVQQFIPTAQKLGTVDGELPVRGVYDGDELLGYIFLSDEILPMPAYSGRPIRTLVAIDLDARIRGAAIIHHEEPILVIGITDADLQRFLAQFTGFLIGERVRIGAHNRPGYTGIDGITGATITSMVLNSNIMKAARLVAESLALPHKTTAQVAAAAQATITAEPPLWVELWREQTPQLVLLSFALGLLMVILFFQDWLVVHNRLFHRVRLGYLLFTVVYLGVYCKGQLSVINLLAFMRILFGGFTWDTLLIDPVIFLLWSFVAVSIILWGRGVFCGWLCPFGALQELIHKVAERYEWPSYEFPSLVHERLWAIKYFILIALVGLSLESMHYAARLAEIEPFKTTFVMRFNRELWFSAYAVLLLVIAVFNSKFYCKYLCPLGAALSFFTRFRIFDWLRRRPECGTPCQSCATQCQISAIKPTGEIIDNECHYCLECQVTYSDEHRCPPLVEKRKKREKREQRESHPADIITSDQPVDLRQGR
jgi:NosR/NirI family nitrous oxide reductase transcriptional regulator